MNKSTVLSRFSDLFGKPIASNKGPFIVGSTKQDYGLTTNFNVIVMKWFQKYREERGKYPSNKIVSSNPLMILPELEYKANDNGIESSIFWREIDLIDGFHVLDNKPFQRITVHYFPNDILPLGATRKVNGESITVLIAPHILPSQEKFKYDEQLKKNKKVVFKDHTINWLKQLPDTTFWFVHDVESNEDYMMCRNCGGTMGKLDWLIQKYRNKHPQCRCSCFTYDDFCGCAKFRDRVTSEKIYRAMSYKRRLYGRELS